MTDRLLRGADRFSRLVTMLLAVAIAGCDVVNPGRVLEADLDQEGALPDGRERRRGRAADGLHEHGTPEHDDEWGAARDLVHVWRLLSLAGAA